MFKALIGITVAAVAIAANSQQTARASAPNIDGTYILVKRVKADGTELKSPAIEGIYTMRHGHGSLNIFWKKDSATLASESTILKYSLTASEYCEWIVYTVRNNIDAPGISTDAPQVANHCTPVKVDKGELVFAPPGEGVTTSFDEKGFKATIAGELTDYWVKIR